MLAYLFDPAEPEFLRERELVRDDRVPRARTMVGKLQELGVPISWEQVDAYRRRRLAWAARTSPPLWSSWGVVETVSDAFTADWLADGGRAYVEKHELDPFDAIRLVKGAGGVTVLRAPAGRQARPGGAGAAMPSSPPPGSTASRSTTWTTTSRPALRCASWQPIWGCWPPAPATTTAAARSVTLGAYTTDPEVYGEITRRATGAFPVPGAGGHSGQDPAAPLLTLFT